MTNSRFRWFLTGCAVFLVSIVACDVRVRAHDAGTWHYPHICCHDADCAPVDWEGEDKEGQGVANTKHHSGISIAPEKYTYRFTSPDGKKHICATPDKAMAPLQHRNYFCIFDAAGM